MQYYASHPGRAMSLILRKPMRGKLLILVVYSTYESPVCKPACLRLHVIDSSIIAGIHYGRRPNQHSVRDLQSPPFLPSNAKYSSAPCYRITAESTQEDIQPVNKFILLSMEPTLLMRHIEAY